MSKSAVRIATWMGRRPMRSVTFVLVWGLLAAGHAAGADMGDPASDQSSAVAQSGVSGAYDARGRDIRHRHRGERPDVNVFIAPQTEHWPSNYVPDGYRLEDYDGQPGSATICRGQSGTTLSTASVDCPEGQRPAAGGRSWSTSP